MVENKWIELAEEHDQLKEDFMILMSRLWLENPDTMSPEVREVMGRYAIELKEWMHNRGAEIDPRLWITKITICPKWGTGDQDEIEEVFRRG